MAARLPGAVYGTHCPPIRDTTILASTGASCRHISHVETQLPYATLVAAVCAAGYLAAGFFGSPWPALALQAVLLLCVLAVLGRADKSSGAGDEPRAAGREEKQR